LKMEKLLELHGVEGVMFEQREDVDDLLRNMCAGIPIANEREAFTDLLETCQEYKDKNSALEVVFEKSKRPILMPEFYE
jgi:hypothetical protein